MLELGRSGEFRAELIKLQGIMRKIWTWICKHKPSTTTTVVSGGNCTEVNTQVQQS